MSAAGDGAGSEAEARSALAAAFRWTARLGWHEAVSNHFSLALDDSGYPFLIQPAGRHFSRVRAGELLKVDAGKHVIAGDGEIDPTAAHLHAGLHAMVPGARCVVHTHMPYATAVACLDDGRVEPISQTALKFYERVAYDDSFAGMILHDDEAERLARMLAEKPVLMMRNHGVVVVGRDVAEAFDRLYFLERACELQVLAQSTGRALARVDAATARRTRDQWESYPGLARAHWHEIRAILDAEQPDYRD